MLKIKIHSTVDVITNSSSITFTKKGNKKLIKEFLSELFDSEGCVCIYSAYDNTIPYLLFEPISKVFNCKTRLYLG